MFDEEKNRESFRDKGGRDSFRDRGGKESFRDKGGRKEFPEWSDCIHAPRDYPCRQNAEWLYPNTLIELINCQQVLERGSVSADITLGKNDGCFEVDSEYAKIFFRNP